MNTQQREMERAAEIYKKIKDERRFKLAYISGDQMVAMFARGIGQPVSNEITRIEGVPGNTLVLGVDYEIEYGAFCFLLGNLEFEPLEENVRPEALKLHTTVDMDAGLNRAQRRAK